MKTLNLRINPVVRRQMPDASQSFRQTPVGRRIAYIFVFSFFFFLSSLMGDGLNDIHPGYTLEDLQPDGMELRVGGIDFFSDGRLLICTWGNTSEVYIMTNPGQASRSIKRFAFGLHGVLGCNVMDDEVYVLQHSELTHLADTDGNGVADGYNKVNDSFGALESLLAYSFDLVNHKGEFYAALSSDVSFGGFTLEPAQPGRSQFIRLNRDNTVTPLASGFRNPYGMGVGFGNKFFSTDNQGAWLPSSKLIHIEEGHFYGHELIPENIFQTEEPTPPVAWLANGNNESSVSKTPGDVTFIEKGIFAGQLFLGELHRSIGNGRLYRVYVEEVDGLMQGAVIPFSSDIGPSVSRMVIDEQGTIYTGLLGCAGWGPVSSTNPGLKRLVAKDVNQSHAFELLAVRSMGPNTIQLEFTEPVQGTGNQTGKYEVRTWGFNPVKQYGGGDRIDEHNLNVTSATLDQNNTIVNLQINGLIERNLVYIVFNNLLSADGEGLWTPKTWFTLNKFGPGNVPETVPVKKGIVFKPAQLNVIRTTSGKLKVEIPTTGQYELEILDLQGKKVRGYMGSGPGFIHLNKREFRQGMYILSLVADGIRKSRRVTLF